MVDYYSYRYSVGHVETKGVVLNFHAFDFI